MVRAIIEPMPGCRVSGSCCRASTTVSDGFAAGLVGTAVGGTGVAVTTTCTTLVLSTILVALNRRTGDDLGFLDDNRLDDSLGLAGRQNHGNDHQQPN